MASIVIFHQGQTTWEK